MSETSRNIHEIHMKIHSLSLEIAFRNCTPSASIKDIFTYQPPLFCSYFSISLSFFYFESEFVSLMFDYSSFLFWNFKPNEWQSESIESRRTNWLFFVWFSWWTELMKMNCVRAWIRVREFHVGLYCFCVVLIFWKV